MKLRLYSTQVVVEVEVRVELELDKISILVTRKLDISGRKSIHVQIVQIVRLQMDKLRRNQ